MDKLKIISGVEMPFFPMRPVTGQVVRTKADAVAFYREIRSSNTWIAQPKLNDDRAVLVLVDEKIYVQNRHGQWYSKPVHNASRWLKLWNRTVLDGGVVDGNFYAFEALVIWGKSLLGATTSEREVMAMQMSRLCGVEWKFNRPDKKFVFNRSANMPLFDGVVLKRENAAYVFAGSATQSNPNWIRRRWS